jgi:hypothetical protein
MRKKSQYIDAAFLAVIAVIIINTLYTYFNSNFLLSLNNYLGFAVWLITLILIIAKPQWGKFMLWPLLLLSAFNILNFTIETNSKSFSFGIGGMALNLPGVNLIFFTALLIYSLINRKTITLFFKKTFRPSEEELLKKQKTMTAFYFGKFVNYNSEEIEEVFKNYNDYPHEAQVALKQIKLAQNCAKDSSLRYP